MRRLIAFIPISTLILLLVSCASSEAPPVYPTPTFAFDLSETSSQDLEIISAGPVIDETAVPFDYASIGESDQDLQKATIEAIQKVEIYINAAEVTGKISPLIYGISLSDAEVVHELQPPIYSWTGDGTVRYNIKTGRGWNAGREDSYQNSDPFPESDNYAQDFLQLAESADALTGFTLPTIGWGAKDSTSCTFADIESGSCTRGLESTCLSKSVMGDPNQTSEPISPADIAEFARSLKANGQNLDLVSVLYEPELWGIVHYDLHPECVTYAEVLDLYIANASAIRDELPDSAFMGPGTCCYPFYFDSAAGEEDKAQHNDTDFIPWFLQSMRAYDQAAGKRHLDVLDIHYYPEGLNNEFDDTVIAAHRLRAPRSLYDPLYADESFIREPIQLIPRLNNWIDEHYPGTKLAISAWNFGAPNTMNGALAVAEVLGIYGQEELYHASYFPSIEKNSPVFHAFKIFTNYDNSGGSFGDLVLDANSSHPEEVSVYSSINSETGNLHVILINKIRTFAEFETELSWDGFESSGIGSSYTVAIDYADSIVKLSGGETQVGRSNQTLMLPSYSITHLILEPSSQLQDPEE